MPTRRTFLKTAAGLVASAAFINQVGAALPSKEGEMIWANLLHLGGNMWGDHPGAYTPCSDKLKCQDDVWKELTDKMAAAKLNMVVIDLGEGVKYESHPELAVEGSWSVDKLRKELDRLRKMGLEPIPKLNFSACHDHWLGEYSRMVSTKKYYEVCADVIHDTMDVFAPVENFHIGFDEEDLPQFHANSSILVMRQGDLWWHDLNWLVREVERRGARAWAWCDYLRRHDKKQFEREFCRKMPKTVVQNPWMYWTRKANMDTEPYTRSFLTLAEAGYDVAPCGSNCYGVTENFPDMAEWCRERIAPERLKGMIMAPWIRTISEYRRLLWQAADLMSEAIERAGRTVWNAERKTQNIK